MIVEIVGNMNAIIVDDEQNFVSALELLIKMNYQNVKILAVANNVAEGIVMIDKHKPNLVFLDINLPDGLGFDIIENSSFNDYEVIFTTSYNEYAVRAFEVSALHYLLKPIDEGKLNEAISRFQEKTYKDIFEQKMRILKDSLNNDPQKIMLQTSNGYQIFNISDIVRCEADHGYSYVYFNDGTKLHITRTLQNMQNTLDELNFVRVHNAHLINLRYVSKYVNGRNPEIIMNDGKNLPISQSHRPEFTDKLNLYVKSV